MSDQDETKADSKTFDYEGFPKDTLFYERRTEFERRANLAAAEPVVEIDPQKPPRERREKKERRRRIDPTTFEKQYTDDEMEFMTAMQRFKVRTGKQFPTHREVLDVVFSLGYRMPVYDFDDESLFDEDSEETEVSLVEWN